MNEFENGLCCLRRHANAIPPWTCDCACHNEKHDSLTPEVVGKTYLGDGAFVEFNGDNIVLTTENGIETTNTVVLGAEEWSALKRWAEERNF